MKSLAIVGMMFLSMGLFAQQTSKAELPVKKNDKTCVKSCEKKCDKAQSGDQMRKAPIQNVDGRKNTVKTRGDHSVKRNPERVDVKQAPVPKKRILAPAAKKGEQVDQKM